MEMDGPLPLPPPLSELTARGPVALFLDFDGTLIEIAATPDEINVPANLGERLTRLGDRLEGRLALVSGRALSDIERHVADCRFARAGSHGAHCVTADGNPLGGGPAALPERTVAAMRDFAAEHGLTYEGKQHGGAIHFRAAPDAEDAVQQFARALADSHELELKSGKAVAELVHQGTSKAHAVRLFMQEPPFAGALPIFIGDDITDEDGFVAVSEEGGFGIAVGERESAGARFRLRDVDAVYGWLGL